MKWPLRLPSLGEHAAFRGPWSAESGHMRGAAREPASQYGVGGEDGEAAAVLMPRATPKWASRLERMAWEASARSSWPRLVSVSGAVLLSANPHPSVVRPAARSAARHSTIAWRRAGRCAPSRGTQRGPPPRSRLSCNAAARTLQAALSTQSAAPLARIWPRQAVLRWHVRERGHDAIVGRAGDAGRRRGRVGRWIPLHVGRGRVRR